MVFCTINAGTDIFTNITISSILDYHPNAKVIVIDSMHDEKPFTLADIPLKQNIEVINGISYVGLYDKLPIVDVEQLNIPSNFQDVFKSKLQLKKNRFKMATTACLHHSANIQSAIDTIQDNFILIDSDAPLKRPVNDLQLDNNITLAEIEHWSPSPRYVLFNMVIDRFLPYFQYINVHQMNQNKVHYFNNKLMLNSIFKLATIIPQNYNVKVNMLTPQFITGCLMLKHVKRLKLKYGEIKVNDYIDHFGGGSWNQDKTQQMKEDFYAKYARLYPHIQDLLK